MAAARSLAERRAYLAWGAVCLIWGTTYLAIKVALESIPPFLLGGVRYVAAGGMLAGVLVARGHTLPGVSSWPAFTLLGALMLGVGNGGVVVAEQWISSGFTAVLIATTPFWMVAVESRFPGGERLTRHHVVGLAVGFAGILLLAWPDLTATHGGWKVAAGVVAVQLACAGWALGSALGRRRTAGIGPMQAAAMQMVFGGLVMLAVGTALGEWPGFRPTRLGLTALAYLTLLGALAAFVAYLYALKHLPVSFVSLYSYVNPVIAVALGALVLGEPLGTRVVVAVAIVLASMAIVTARRRGP